MFGVCWILKTAVARKTNTENGVTRGMLIKPNPTNSIITITSEKDFIEEINIFDINGRIVFSKKYDDTNNNKQIDVSNFTNGVYKVNINDDVNLKFIKID